MGVCLGGDRGNRGKGWENSIDLQHEVYRKAGAAYIQRNFPGMRAVGNRFIPIAEGPPDYTVIARGRVFVIEAKECHQARWKFSLLEDHQARAFEAAEKHGARALVLLRFTGDVAVAILWSDLREPWLAWRRKQATKASINAAEAQEIARWAGGGNKSDLPDYLQTICTAIDLLERMAS